MPVIQPGSKLAHYEIVSALGKGGMGEVWRAKDTKLGRDVAIKTLPPKFAEDADRLARFEREARLLASLNHPTLPRFLDRFGEEARGFDSALLRSLESEEHRSHARVWFILACSPDENQKVGER